MLSPISIDQQAGPDLITIGIRISDIGYKIPVFRRALGLFLVCQKAEMNCQGRGFAITLTVTSTGGVEVFQGSYWNTSKEMRFFG